MVYCGKASQSCENCRIRRIKCNKAKPECLQCLRAGKNCPGYRDQLSLLFRDENSKVIRKAHAQWAIPESLDGAAPDFILQTSSRSFSATPVPALRWSQTPPSGRSFQSLRVPASSPATFAPDPSLAPSIEERGVQFYVNRYLIGHLGDVRNPKDLAVAATWLRHPALQDAVIAIGLAALANLSANVDMMNVARQKYGLALQQTGVLINKRSETPDMDITLRSVVMLALFEVVKWPHYSSRPAVSAHVMGGAALMQIWCSLPEMQWSGLRALLELVYSMFITAQARGGTQPSSFLDWIAFTHKMQSPSDRPSMSLARLITRFIQLSSLVKRHALYDGRPNTANVIRQLLDVDAELDAWESGLSGIWLFRTEQGSHLPPKAVFHGHFHVYYDMWTARVWNFYRWVRILVNQTLIHLVDQYPTSSLSLALAIQRDLFLDTILRLSRDMFASVPTHWRHPLLVEAQQILVETPGGGTYGGAAIPLLLSFIKVAACAPGVPIEYVEWAVGIVHCIWSDSGMLHAHSILEAMRLHQDAFNGTHPEG